MSFYRIEPTIRYTLAMFFRKFLRFSVVQVHQLNAPRCGKTHILAWQLLGAFSNRWRRFAANFFHSSFCHACLGQASVSLTALRMPTNLLHHRSQNRIQKKTIETWWPKGTSTVQETKWDAEREKACVITYAHASASQICLQNLCEQQQNSPMADSTLGPNRRAQHLRTPYGHLKG